MQNETNMQNETIIPDYELYGIALACAQIKGSIQILADMAEETDDARFWAVNGSLTKALELIDPLQHYA